MTDDVTFAATPESRRYVLGPMVELGLPLGFAVEIDALYHRQGYLIPNLSSLSGISEDQTLPIISLSAAESERANSWEFPILLKYKLPIAKVKPFLEVGIAPRTISGTIVMSGETLNIETGQAMPYINTSKTDWSASVGIVAGGGIQFALGPLRLAPEVRYTHWTTTPINVSFGDGPSFASSQEQIDVLIGVFWKIR